MGKIIVFQKGYLIVYTLKVTIYCQKHDKILISREKKTLNFWKIRSLFKFGLGRIFTSLGIFGLSFAKYLPLPKWKTIQRQVLMRKSMCSQSSNEYKLLKILIEKIFVIFYWFSSGIWMERNLGSNRRAGTS